MAKGFAPPENKEAIIKTSFRAPERLPEAIADHLTLIGRSPKRRTQWIIETAKRFIVQSDAADIATEEFIARGSTTLIPIRAPRGFLEALDEAGKVFTKTTGVEIDRSCILRAAILQGISSGTRMAFDPADVQRLKEMSDED